MKIPTNPFPKKRTSIARGDEATRKKRKAIKRLGSLGYTPHVATFLSGVLSDLAKCSEIERNATLKVFSEIAQEK